MTEARSSALDRSFLNRVFEPMNSGDAHEEATGVLNVHELMRLLPHRYPLLLVDRVTQCLPGKHISGYKNVTREETSFGNKCRDSAVMPHLLIVEALAQISVVLALKSLRLIPTGRELMFFGGIKNARFEGNVRPGDRLVLNSDVTRIRKMMGWFSARATVDGREIVSVEMIAAIKAPG